ncbi:MAG: hypothetical protein U0K47_01560, partial [Erysipelotrichaceae bacterium]|nr:hypothetical protein [Erysipelotrichaceae bacterium]
MRVFIRHLAVLQNILSLQKYDHKHCVLKGTGRMNLACSLAELADQRALRTKNPITACCVMRF